MTWCSCIASSSAACVLGGVRLISSASITFAKTGPRTKRSARAPPVLVEDLGAGDVGRHQVRRELDALEAQVEDLGERADQQRLGQAGHAGQQAVAAGEERDQQLLDDVVLADDHLAQLLADAAAAFDDTGDDFLGGRGHGHGLHVAPGSHGQPQWVSE